MKLSAILLTIISSCLLRVDAMASPPWRFTESRHRIEERQTKHYRFQLRTFDQTIDHFPDSPRYEPHTKGTFAQRYIVDSRYYKPGGPIFLYIGSEATLETLVNFFSPTSIFGTFNKRFNGLGIILEDRYYGESQPYDSTTTDQLTYMTTEQTIADIQEFALHVKLPGFRGINAPRQPWILYGGSLSGSRVAFTMKTYGNVLYAGISSSAIIHAVHAYPEWYDPIQKLAPQDCVASINDIIDKMDMLIDAKLTNAIQHLQQIFGLESLTDIRDFARAIAFPLGNPFFYPTQSYQELYWDSRSGHREFYDFCLNVTNLNPPAKVSQTDHELSAYTGGEQWTNLGNYAAYIKQYVLPLCTSRDFNSFDCFGTQHPDRWADTAYSLWKRSYLYTTCTELGAYLVAQPPGQKSLVSRVLNVNYTQQWCDWSFPKGKYNSIPSVPNNTLWNLYGGLNMTADRLLFIDGDIDPWISLSYHSSLAPERYPNDAHPEYLINGGGHVWDMWTAERISTEPQFMKDAHLFEIKTVKRWLKEFRAWKVSMANDELR